jgi:hypothetical protein
VDPPPTLGIFRVHRIDNDPVAELELFVGKRFNYEVGSTASFEAPLDSRLETGIFDGINRKDLLSEASWGPIRRRGSARSDTLDVSPRQPLRPLCVGHVQSPASPPSAEGGPAPAERAGVGWRPRVAVGLVVPAPKIQRHQQRALLPPSARNLGAS